MSYTAIFLLSTLLVTKGFANDASEEIPIQDIPLKDREQVQKVIGGKTSFLKWREEEIETSASILNYIFDRPVLTATILMELGIAQYQIDKDKRIFHFDDGDGLTGELRIIYKRGEERTYRGTYTYSTGAGIPLRLSGEWVSVLKYKKEDAGEINIDIDLYLKEDEKGLSKATRNLPFIIESVMTEKMNSYIESLRELSEWIKDDPDEVYDKLKESGKIGERDLKEFKKAVKQ